MLEVGQIIEGVVEARPSCSDGSVEHDRLKFKGSESVPDFGSEEKGKMMRVRRYVCLDCGNNLYDNNKEGYSLV